MPSGAPGGVVGNAVLSVPLLGAADEERQPKARDLGILACCTCTAPLKSRVCLLSEYPEVRAALPRAIDKLKGLRAAKQQVTGRVLARSTDPELRQVRLMDSTAPTRRQFLAGATLGVAWVTGNWAGIAAAHAHAAAVT